MVKLEFTPDEYDEVDTLVGEMRGIIDSMSGPDQDKLASLYRLLSRSIQRGEYIE
jgi:hypothetical protein